jgi:hypothetical protein
VHALDSCVFAGAYAAFFNDLDACIAFVFDFVLVDQKVQLFLISIHFSLACLELEICINYTPNGYCCWTGNFACAGRQNRSIFVFPRVQMPMLSLGGVQYHNAERMEIALLRLTTQCTKIHFY